MSEPRPYAPAAPADDDDPCAAWKRSGSCGIDCPCITRPAPGDRVRLLRCDDEADIVPPGTEGTVHFIDDLGTVFVDWDNGYLLGVIPGVDVFEVIS